MADAKTAKQSHSGSLRLLRSVMASSANEEEPSAPAAAAAAVVGAEEEVEEEEAEEVVVVGVDMASLFSATRAASVVSTARLMAL